MVNQVYRLMKAGVARRVLFLVDRRVLARQAAQAFAAFEAEPGMKFTNIYQVYSQGIQHGDDEDDRLDFEKLPNAYLEQPQPSHTYVYGCTIQRMAINLFGRGAVFEGDDETIDDDAERLNIPIHAFDVVIADECHRGYTSAVDSPWRRTLDHFDAIKIGLTATPAAHTTTYFKDVVYRYEYERAVAEGWLVDYNAVALKSGVRMNGVFLQEGEQVGTIDAASGAEQLDTLEAERAFDATEIERQVTVPDSNRKLLEEIKRHALAHEQEYGRFPKTLIFAVNDIPHVSHADMLVDMARDVFGRGNAFVEKITGKVDRPLQKIKEFRNRERIGIVVTVDLLSTGVDIPDLEYIVFLRPVKSRILFEQIMGRGTRKGWLYPTKSHFTVFDCFDGTLLEYFRQATAITVEPPVRETKTIAQIVEDIWQNRDRDYNVRCLVKRLQRVDKEMSGEARELFAAYEIVDGDLAGFAARLPGLLRQDFTGTMRLLRDPGFQDLLVHYPRPPKGLLVAYDTVDEVTSRRLIRDGAGHEYRPEDYLTAFWRFVREKATEIEAIGILLERPRDWSTDALGELRRKLAAAPERFTVERLQQAHEAQYRKALVDVISMVKHAADAEQPLLTAAERVDRAIARITAGRALSDEQAQWLERIRQHLVANLSIDRDDFEEMPVLANAGGWGRANRAFDGRLTDLVRNLNEAVAA
jgi:type I restriction enzyme R subunit